MLLSQTFQSTAFCGDTLNIKIGETIHLSKTHQLLFRPSNVTFIEYFGSIPDYVEATSDSVRVDGNNLASVYFSITLKEGAESGKAYKKNIAYLFFNNSTSVKIDYSFTVIEPAPMKADFSADKVTGTYPLTVAFQNNSTGDIKSYLWDFGDDNTSTEKSPHHTYTEEGTYNVSLIVKGDSESDTLAKANYITVTVPAPIADFSADTTSGNASLTVKFTDASTGNITTRSWDFGDGGTSTEQNPSYTYTNPGVYTVSLTVSGAGGSNTKTKTEYITVLEPTSVFDVSSDGRILIFPNPAHSICKVKIPGEISGIVSIKIFSTNGVALISKTGIKDRFCEIDVTELSVGLYYISIISANTILTDELIIKE